MVFNGRTTRLRWIALLCAIVGFACSGGAQTKPVDLQALLRGPERHEFRWDVRVGDPRLTLQQRYVVYVNIRVDPRHVISDGLAGKVYFLANVADRQGHWLAEADGSAVAYPAHIDNKSEIRYSDAAYIRPGKYVIVVVGYDTSSHKVNVQRIKFQFSGPRHDRLADLDKQFPAVQFVGDVPFLSSTTRDPGIPRPEWRPVAPRVTLPVKNSTPVRIDLVLNLSNWLIANGPDSSSKRQYLLNVQRIVQIGNMLSELQLAHGCVRVSAIDINNEHLVYNQVDTSTVDWEKARHTLDAGNPDLVDIATLEKRAGTATFFRRFLSDVLYQPDGCGPGDTSPRHVVIIVGDEFGFGEGTLRPTGVWPEMPCDCRFYYWRVGIDRAPIDDDIDRMLKPLRPRRAVVGNPRAFRAALADLIGDLQDSR